jgi:Coenzyme PQQ synthesis protein D (PqqD)
MYYSVDLPNIASNNFDGEIIIADYDNGSYFSLTETSAEIWLGLAAGHSVEAIAAAFARLYPEDGASASERVRAFITDLEANQVIRQVGEPAQQTDWSPRRHAIFLPPAIERYDDLKELLVLDPVHDAAAAGWPLKKD